MLLSANRSAFDPPSEVQCLFELGVSHVVLCGVIHQPPKYNKDFISDFSEFLAEFLPKYDRVLIVGDFNSHFCCPGANSVLTSPLSVMLICVPLLNAVACVTPLLQLSSPLFFY